MKNLARLQGSNKLIRKMWRFCVGNWMIKGKVCSCFVDVLLFLFAIFDWVVNFAEQISIKLCNKFEMFVYTLRMS